MMEPVARAIANLVIFMEYTPSDLLDEDASIEAMEQLGGDLKELDAESLRSLCASFRSIAPTYDGEMKTFVEELPHTFGLEPPPEDEERA